MSLIFSLLRLTLFRSTWAVFQIMQRSSYLRPWHPEALPRTRCLAAASVRETGLVAALHAHTGAALVGRASPGFPAEGRCQLLSTGSPGALPPGSAEIGECTHTHLFGCLGLMLTGGPGGPSFLGKMSTHICIFPWSTEMG